MHALEQAITFLPLIEASLLNSLPLTDNIFQMQKKYQNKLSQWLNG